MVASSSVSNMASSLDWADDTDDEIDFGAPVFSDDDDFPRPASPPATPSTASSGNKETATPSQAGSGREPARYTAGFTDGSNRSLDRRTHNGSALQPMSSRIQPRDHQQSYRDSPRPHHGHNNGSYGSPQSEGKWGRNADSSRGSSAHQSRSSTPRTTIPLPPKPAPELDANNYRNNNQARMDRSRSPSYRSRSPLPNGLNDRLSWENSKHQRPSSPYTSGRGAAGGDHQRRSLSPSTAHLNNPGGISTGRSLSPSPRSSRAYMDQVSAPNGRLINNPDGFSTGRSSSPAARPSRSYMDQVTPPSRDRLNRRSRDAASEGRWEKTLQEDKPYPNLHPSSATNGSPKDDTVHFKRRETGATRPSGHEPSRNDRSTGGTMYHERLESSTSARSQRPSSGPGDRWEKTPMPEDLPYPVNSPSGKHNRTGSRGKLDVPLLSSSPSEKSSPRGSRGKGKDAQKRRSKDQPTAEVSVDDNNASTEESGKPWWEQSTYGTKPKTAEPAKSTESAPQSKKDGSSGRERQESQKPKATPSKPNTAPSSKQETSAQKVSAKESEPQEVPWWEQSTYKAKPKSQDSSAASVSGLTTQLAKANLNKDDEPVLFLAANRQKSAASASGDDARGDLAVDADTLSRRMALDQKSTGSGVEALTLLSRGGDDSGSSNSLKARHVQEKVFAEIKTMIKEYEQWNGVDKLVPIQPKSRQAEKMDVILESFRKLREGLFASESKDAFTVEVYEQSVLNSLYAGNIPELTKALHHLVQYLHPEVYPVPDNDNPQDLVSNSLARIATIPQERKRFMALYILHHLAHPPRVFSATNGGGVGEGAKVLDLGSVDSLSKAVLCPKTETDLLISSMLHGFQQYQRLPAADRKMDSKNPLGPDLFFALAYWKALRDGQWQERERLLKTEGSLAWDLRLMVYHGMGDGLCTSRSLTVATISKAYYSLPVAVLAEAVGLSSSSSAPSGANNQELENEQLKTLKAKFGLAPRVVVRDGQIMFKVKVAA
ncbi:hypothetical protein EMPS_05002 [Entomortierella parvispora]|uniref:Uncharacterized protein n=1 Tax=Entomortierella parvispora TaxID=205924 RepID=A0A9P3H9G9_9FUNG|nr:hypothetical protein EMPS_05002 [Entomortierella parvispora]